MLLHYLKFSSGFPCNQSKFQTPYNGHQDPLYSKHGRWPTQTAFPPSSFRTESWFCSGSHFSLKQLMCLRGSWPNSSCTSRYNWLEGIPILFQSSRKRMWPKGILWADSRKFKEKKIYRMTLFPCFINFTPSLKTKLIHIRGQRQNFWEMNLESLALVNPKACITSSFISIWVSFLST